MAEGLHTLCAVDLSNDERGYPKVGWLIAHWLLRDLSEHGRNTRLYAEGFGDTVHQNIWHMARYLQDDCNIPVYRSPKGSRLEYITLDKNYREAEAMDFNRIADRDYHHTRATIKEIKFKHAGRLLEFAGRTQQLLPAASANSEVRK
jgi:hypothetical protein